MLGALYAIVIEPLVLVIELVFSLLYRVLGTAGPAVVGLSVVVSALLLPLYARADALQLEERDKQAAMAHWVDHIKARFKGDEQYLLLSTYYRQQGYSQLSQLKGSISLLLQVPFFIAAYRYLSGLQALSGVPFWFVRDLAQPDALFAVGGFSVNVLPIAMTLLNVASSAVYTRGLPHRDKVQAYGLALVFLVLLYDRPAGLVLYWTCNQVFSLVKNVFSRVLRNPGRDLAVLVTLLLVALGAWLLLTGRLGSMRRRAVLGAVAVAVEALALAPLLPHRRRQPRGRHAQATADAAHADVPALLFPLEAACLSLLVGLVVPAALIGSSPADFINVYDYVNPLASIAHVLLVCLGLFALWGGVYHYLSDTGGRRLVAGLYLLACGIAVTDFFLFGRNLGIIDSNLVFDGELTFSDHERMVNLAAIAAVTLVLLVTYLRRPAILCPALGILTAALVAVSVPNLMTINEMATAKRAEADAFLASTASDSTSLFGEDGSIQPIARLSREGRNVMVLFVDMAESRFVPYILAERPELVEQLDGFTYYPNTISFGGHTVMSAPSIYGGYEYTLAAINARTDTTVEQDTSEALQVLPAVLNREGFDVTVTDETRFAWDQGYEDNPIYDAYEHVREYELIGVYANYGTYSSSLGDYSAAVRESFLRNLFFYGILKVSPVIMQPAVYDEGLYYSTLANHSINDQFVNNYAVLANMGSLVEVVDGTGDNALVMHSKLPHSPQVLSLPDYELSLFLSDEDLGNDVRQAPGEEPLVMDTELKLAYYHAEMSLFIELGAWFDQLRAAGVWDNTRIIIVSDHGNSRTYFPDFVYEDLNLGEVNALLMVKDFGDTGFEVSHEFMTCADTPSLAIEGVVADTTNPLTGNPITMDDKQGPQVVTSSGHQRPEHHPGTSYDTSDHHLYSVHDDLFDPNNWTMLD